MATIQIGERIVGDGAPTLIVAELSANHGGSRDIALKTIEAAARASVDAIKLQTYTPDTLTLRSDAADFVVKTKNSWSGRTLHDLYAEAMTPWAWHQELFDCAKSLGLLCFSTPFDATAVELLEELKAPTHKIASFELVDLPLVERIARTMKPLIISTGMATLGEIEAAVATCRSVGNDSIALLRCVSSYPAHAASMHLQSIGVLRSFGTVVGLSDHTREHTVAIAAVALGARVIEKHFILDRAQGGPDAFFSLEPDEMRALVTCVRDAEQALGAPRFGPSEEERASVAFRRSLYVAQDVSKGDVLTCDHVRSVRPSFGLSPSALPDVLGRVASRDLSAATPLTWDSVGPAPHAPTTLTLTQATLADSGMLLAWRNEEVTRAMSLSNAQVSPSEHEAWFAGVLANDQRALLVARAGQTPIGTLRLDVAGQGVNEISLTVAPEARGRGLAFQIIRAAEPIARARGCVTLIARILPSNLRSIAAFKRAGYYAFASRNEGERVVLWCERRIVGF